MLFADAALTKIFLFVHAIALFIALTTIADLTFCQSSLLFKIVSPHATLVPGLQPCLDSSNLLQSQSGADQILDKGFTLPIVIFVTIDGQAEELVRGQKGEVLSV